MVGGGRGRERVEREGEREGGLFSGDADLECLATE